MSKGAKGAKRKLESRKVKVNLRKRQGVWEHIGGGCLLDSHGPANLSEFDCDDEYENTVTKEHVVLISTLDAHFAMPLKARSLTDLTRREGVKLVEGATCKPKR